MENQIKSFIKQAANVKPTERQLKWFDLEFYAFAHFSPNTFTDLEWGTGKESPSIFNPQKLDCDQWVSAFKDAGMTALVLTAKHHDGFCLWPSKYTEHSVKNSPMQRDVVKEAAEACRRGGIKFGFYLSPWDRNSKYYGTPEYNDYFKNQLTELLTEYGEIFHVWFDGACGEGANGKKQIYDFDGYAEIIRKYQPNATIFSDFGPDVRWCGNEEGVARYAEWAIVPKELCYRAEVQTGEGPLDGDLSYIYSRDPEIGSLSNILYSKGLVFCGSEFDMSIRPGWFWHKREEPRSLERLFNTYITTVGSNACLNLNVPPNSDGLIDERDVKRLKELGDKIRAEFSHNLAENATIEKVDFPSDSQCVYDVKLSSPQKIKYVVIGEDMSQGQRVETFRIQTFEENGEINNRYKGTCIGNKKICPVDFETDKVRIFVTAARDTVNIKKVEMY